MFTGSIPGPLRGWLLKALTSLRGQLTPGEHAAGVQVICSGNMVVERLAINAGFERVSGCDVSLYSCLLGALLSGQDVPVKIRDSRLDWLSEFMDTPLRRFVTVGMCLEALQSFDKDRAWHARMWDGYQLQWARIHEGICQKVEATLGGVQLAEFHAEDLFSVLERTPSDRLVIGFPPTYKSGYERLYKAVNAAFEWDAPAYSVYDPEEGRAALADALWSRDRWCTLFDHPVDEWSRFEVARIRQGGKRTVHVYGRGIGDTAVLKPSPKEDATSPWPIYRGPVEGPVWLARCDTRVFRRLRNLYLSSRIAEPADPTWAFAVLCEGGVLGCIGFSVGGGTGADWCDIYMLSDFAIYPSAHKRLSKLVLAMTKTQEMRALLENAAGKPLEKIGTTAFTKQPISMKYRGLYELHSRKDGFLNYVSEFGWTASQAMEWWREKHAGAQKGAA